MRRHGFPFPGRGGAIRDALRIGRIAFDDDQVSFECFAEQKAKGELPFGSLPVVDVVEDGRT